VKVRSPLKCRQAKGVCAHCYGLDEHGHLPEIGDNVGAKAGQTISEPLVQIAMNAFHTGGVAGTGAKVDGFKRVEQLLHLPDKLTGSAALSPVDGKITKVTKGIAGGYDVMIGDVKVHVSQGLIPLGVGSTVKRGDPLSNGPIRPQDLTAMRGVEATQDYLTDQLQSTYKEQKVGISRKTFETVVRSLTNATQVMNNPRHSSFIPGDVVPYTEVRAYNENRNAEMDVDEAIGMNLAQDYGLLKAGKTLTDKDILALKTMGHKRVKVSREEILHQPFVKGLTNIPLMRKDWMAALGYRNLSKVLTEGAAQGWETDVEGYHPIPALAHGITFGKGKEGKY